MKQSKKIKLNEKIDVSKIYYSYCGLGDVCFSLPALNLNGRKIESLILNPKLYPVKTLLEKQPYINNVKLGEHDEFHFRMSHLQLLVQFNFSNIILNYLACLGFQISKFEHKVENIKLGGVGDLDIGLYKRENNSRWPKRKALIPFDHSFIDVPDESISTKEIAICWTPRNRQVMNDCLSFNWKLLKKYEDKCVFLGGELEHKKFKSVYNINCDYVKTKDFYELSRIFKGVKMVVGTQCGPTSLAMTMGIPLLIEISKTVPTNGIIFKNHVSWINEDVIEYFLSSNIKFNFKHEFIKENYSSNINIREFL
jgi:hypothetical protein